MSIGWDPARREFHLRNDTISYVIGVLENGWLGQLYFGAALTPGRSYRHLGGGEFHGFSNRVGEPVGLEYPAAGAGDYRVPAVVIAGADGATVLDLRYREHRIATGKPDLPGLPSTYVEEAGEADTVEIVLADEPTGAEVLLRYTIFRDHPIVARSARIRNAGTRPLTVTCAMSASLDLPDATWDFVHLSGTWARERHVVARPLAPGRQSISSLRGASGLEHNPFAILRRPATTEDHGEAYGFSLVYSGNFLAEAEVDAFNAARFRLGINPDGFAWALEPGAEFEVPEAVLAYSDHGIGALSDAYHALYRERLARGYWRDRLRPVLINNWEATYFDFDQAKLLAFARAASDLGIELFVLDDGWYGARDDDTSSLGDWFVDRRKLPDGLGELGRRVEALGLSFGIWIEPEMVSERSHLFAEHPDWAIGVPGRPRTASRSQYVLDMGRPEVVDHLAAVLTDVLGSAPIRYVKWDMNRNVTEPYGRSLPPYRQGEFFHRYILGVYELYRRLTAAFPEILFESCASGGGRFDPGMLAYAPQTWTSDNTDAVERLSIQAGTSLVYPLSAIGAHVAAVPNHQSGRITPIATRAAVAFFGVFGYELDPTDMTHDERRAVIDQVAFYKRYRDLFQRGRFIRLRGPFDGNGNETAWMVVGPDRRRAVAGYFRVLNQPDPGPALRLRLRGLDPGATYAVTPWAASDGGPARTPGTAAEGDQPGSWMLDTPIGGDELMQAGLVVGLGRWEAARAGDFWARLFAMEVVER